MIGHQLRRVVDIRHDPHLIRVWRHRVQLDPRQTRPLNAQRIGSTFTVAEGIVARRGRDPCDIIGVTSHRALQDVKTKNALLLACEEPDRFLKFIELSE